MNQTNYISRRNFGKALSISIGGIILNGCINKNKIPNRQTFQFVEHKNPEPFNKNNVPEPIFDNHPHFHELYWVAWEHAWNHVAKQRNIPRSPYMDEAFWPDTIWIWDTCFMTFFSKYAPDTFPGIESLDNFYEIMYNNHPSPLFIQHPDNPPLFAWAEWEYYKHTGNKARLERILNEEQFLQQHYSFFENRPNGAEYPWCGEGCYPTIKNTDYGFFWDADANGMDNTPRGYRNFGNMLWLDALAQQALSAKYIAKAAIEIGKQDIYVKYNEYYNQKAKILNTYYWNNSDGIYYDIRFDDPSQQYKIKTPASYWPMLAEICSKEQAKKLNKHAQNPNIFGGEMPWPSVDRESTFFEPKGNYWRGSIWLPTAYMAIKSLEKYGFNNTANKTAYNLINHMANTFKNYTPHTIWECYSPSAPAPGTTKNNTDTVRPNFCGWSALGPISLFIENVLGFYDVDAPAKTVKWNIKWKVKHGIKRLKFGNTQTDIIYNNGKVEVNSNNEYTLEINSKKLLVKPGHQTINI